MSAAGAVPVSDGFESPPLKKSMSSPLTFTQINVLALIVVLAASGLVCVEDMAFVAFSSIYILVMSKFAFPPPSAAAGIPPPVFQRSRLFACYVWTGAAFGIFLPLLYIFGGAASGHRAGVLAAAPHVFLLLWQIFWETVTFRSPRFSLPIRAFVPVFYNTRRVFTILEWLRTEFGEPAAADAEAAWWRGRVGQALAVANLAFWCFNLFCFLLPVYLPKAFRRYFEEERQNEMPKKDE